MFQSKESMAEELLDAMNARGKYEIVARRISARLSTYGISEVLLEAVMCTIDDMISSTAKIYCERLDRKTMKGLLKFYKSSIGRQFMTSSQKIDSDLILLSTEWNSKVLNIANELLIRDAAKKGINARDYIPPLEI